MGVKLGYKQTEVGFIPEDWEIKTFEKLFNFSGGYSASRDQLSSEGHCYLHYGDIHGATKTTVDVQTDYQSIPKLNIPLKRVASKSLLEDGDVVFVDASEDNEGTSRHVVVVNKDKKPFISGLHTIVAKSKTDELAHEYRRYCFQTAAIRQQFLFYAVGTKVSGISKTSIAKLKLPVPPLPEQRAIAEVLSDVDRLLVGLERLIVKKRDLKRAAIQQLLTGQIRLPGFRGEWQETTIGQLGDTYGGLTGKTKADFGHGPASYITFLNIMNNVVIDTKLFEQVEVDPSEHQNMVSKGDLFFNGSSETPEEVGMCAVLLGDISNVYLNSFCFGFRLFDKNSSNGLYLAYFFRSEEGRKLIYSLAQGATRHNISKTALLATKFRLPSFVEQTAIAEALADVDAELAALDANLNKTRDIKQAMMQELLAGKTRLVTPEASRA